MLGLNVMDYSLYLTVERVGNFVDTKNGEASTRSAFADTNDEDPSRTAFAEPEDGNRDGKGPIRSAFIDPDSKKEDDRPQTHAAFADTKTEVKPPGCELDLILDNRNVHLSEDGMYMYQLGIIDYL